MMQNNDSLSLGKCGSFCSECKFILNSIYNIGTALWLNECETITDRESRDRNVILNERVEALKEDIINKTDEKLHNSQCILPSSIPHVKYQDSVTSKEEIQVLLDKKLEVKKVDKKVNEFNKICVSHDHENYSTYVKPTIIEDKILQCSEKLKINDLKKLKSQVLNYKCNDSKYSTSHKAIKYVDKLCKGVGSDSRDLKNEYGIERQRGQSIGISCSVIPTQSKSQKTENEIPANTTSDYRLQYSKLRNSILNRRKKISNIAKNLLALSTYLNGICKTILQTEGSNPSSIPPYISMNLSEKVNKSTSPILLSETCPTVANLAQSQENSYDMYRYNPYRPKHSLQKKI